MHSTEVLISQKLTIFLPRVYPLSHFSKYMLALPNVPVQIMDALEQGPLLNNGSKLKIQITYFKLKNL